MKVRELIEKLQQCDPDLPVVVSPIRSYPNIDSGSIDIPSQVIRFDIKIVAYSREMIGEMREFACIGYEEFDELIVVETAS